MKYYTTTTEFNCGIDLHSRQMYICVMDRTGKKLVHTNITDNDFEYFLKLVAPYRHDLTVCCECIFNWYWLADACHRAKIEFVLAHALYMKAIHGGKNKNDRIDSEKITHLLRSNLIPPSYVYPADKRPVRALLRQRICYVWRRAELLSRIQSHQLAEGFRTVKDFSSFCRLVKGSVASAGKIKGSRGAKLGNPYLRWAFGEAAVIAKRNHYLLHPYAQQLEAVHGKFKANAILANKIARAVYFMLKEKTVFDPEKLIALPSNGKAMV